MNALRSAVLTGLLASIALAGCAGATAPSPSPSAPPPTDPPPTQVPGGRDGSPSPDDGMIGGGGTNPGGPGAGQPNLVVAKPGTTVDPHPVAIETLEAQIDGRKVAILATWWSGVEPCYVLDTVTVKQEGNAFTVSMTEGRGGGDVMCIEIAQQHATAIDLGELEPGDYTVKAQDGTAQPISFTID